MIKILTVEGMSCGHCEMAVKKSFRRFRWSKKCKGRLRF